MRILAIIAFICYNITNIYSQENLEFIENKGQWHKDIKYKTDINKGALYLLESGYKITLFDTLSTTYKNTTEGNQENREQKKILPSKNLVFKAHTYDVIFENASKNSKIIPEKAVITTYNYFIGNDSTKWAANCKSFYTVTYKNIYPFTDIKFYINEGKIKYDIIVYPRGDPSKVKFRIVGADNIKLKKNILYIHTTVDTIQELLPICYQVGISKKKIDCNFKLNQQTISFNTAQYDKTKILVIDPELVFATYINNINKNSPNWSISAAIGKDRSSYIGTTISLASIDTLFTTIGAYERKFDNVASEFYFVGYAGLAINNMLIIKLSADGKQKIAATFLGGRNGSEYPQSMFVDNDENLVIFGMTSSNDYPVKSAGFGVKSPIVNFFISKLSSSLSSLNNSILFGGSTINGINIERSQNQTPQDFKPISLRQQLGDDVRKDIAIDNANNIYIVGCTQSNDFPITTDAIQKTNKGGDYKQDAVYMKFSPDLNTLIYSTYLGGTGDDAGYGLAINKTTNDVYVVGATASNDFTGNTAGTVQPGFNGGIADGFICRFTSNGTVLQNISYMGTSGIDNIYAVALDKKGFP